MAANIDSLEPAKNISSRSGRIRLNVSENIISGLVVLSDAFVTFVAGIISLLLYLDAGEVDLGMYVLATTFTSYVVVCMLHAGRLYSFSRIVTPGSQFFRIAGACAAAFLLVVAVAYLFKVSEIFSRGWAIIWLYSTILLLQATRVLAARVIAMAARKGYLTRRVVVFGSNEFAKRLVTNMADANTPWNEILGVFDDRSERADAVGPNYPIAGNLRDLLTSARRERVDEVFVSLPFAGPNSRIDQVLAQLSVLPARVNLQVCDSLAKYLRNDVRNAYGVCFTSIYERPMTGWKALMKRAFDLAVSSVVSLVSLPFFALIAVAIKLDSPGPVFFRQERFGFNDELIPVWKFRTMYQDQTDKNAERLATVDDPRITRVGNFLRRTSLDELPQIFNVLNGSMSLVGPRPHATRAKAAGRLYQEVIQGYGSRHRVKPGITGWAQVNGWRGETDVEEKIIKRVEHDLYYISHWSLPLDIEILLRTIKVVFKGDNAY